MRKIKIVPLIGLLAWICLTSCTIYQPEIRGVESVKINRNRDAGKGQVAVDVGIRVFNPNNYKLALKRYNLEFYLNGKDVGTAKSDEKIKFAKNEETVVTCQLNTSTKKLAGAAIWGGLSGLAQGGKFTVKVTGNAKGKARGIGKTFKIDHEEPVDLNLDQWLK